MTNVLLENTVCCNTGDCAIMLCAEQSLKEIFGSNLHLTIFDYDAETAGRFYPEYNFRPFLARRMFALGRTPSRMRRMHNRLRNLRARTALVFAKSGLWPVVKWLLGSELCQDLKTYAEADLVLTTGGTYLVENYTLKERIAQFQIDLTLGKAPIFFTQSLGPFTQEENITGLQPVFDAAPLILLRDQKSAGHLQGLIKDPQKCHVMADSVFMLADLARLKECLSKPAPASSAPLRHVAISVREWPYFKQRTPHEGMDYYKKSLAALCSHLIQEHGTHITFISSCQGIASYTDDSRVAECIIDLLPEDLKPNITLKSGHHTPQQIMTILKDMDLLVGTRMHMMILGLCVGTPVLPISYEFKTTELMTAMGLAQILCDIETITPDDLCAKAALLMDDLPNLHRRMMEETITLSSSAQRATSLIRDYSAPAAKRR